MKHQTIKRFTILTGVNTFSGYGSMSISFARGIEALTGVYVQIRAVSFSELFGAAVPADIQQRIVRGPQPEAWELLIHPPNFAPTRGKKTAYLTMWETTKLPPMGASLLNEAEVVITPSQFNAATFSASGVTKPIRVVPLGVDPEIFHWQPRKEGGPFTFGAAGRMAHGGVRKGLADVIVAFQSAFPKSNKNVRLKVKCHADCGITPPGDPRIEVVAAHLTEEQLAEWYASLSCFVSVARCEGWGLMQHQAMATGRPLISPKFGGVAEFFDHRCGLVLPHKLVPAAGMYEGQGHWAEASERDLVEAMRFAHAYPAAMELQGAEASRRVGEMTWERSHLALVAVLKEFGALR